MNHAVYTIPALAIHEKEKENHSLYDALVAAITDINITLPSPQKLLLEIQNNGDEYFVHISQKGEILQRYEIAHYPHIIRRMWTHITLGFVDRDRVEILKSEILELYQHEPVIL
ncbi:hypothetical protein KBB89_00510 [Candidatus Gracilibacteria bacterium]|nr:hypothetical protein [Candidatus Gracilibacteria bacterium]